MFWSARFWIRCNQQGSSQVTGYVFCIQARCYVFLLHVHIIVTVFASSEPVPGMNDGTLQLAFVELRQLLDLVIQGDWCSYLHDYGSEKNKYLRVQPNTLLAVLEK